ncbi:MAG: 3-hydroxyacyl-CoA dehydrogenase family protein, partial [Clostridiales bacterium]
PFGIMDKIGLDVMHELLPDSKNKAEKLKLFESMVGEGRSGFKTGGGFYDYPAPAYTKSDFVVRPKSIK